MTITDRTTATTRVPMDSLRKTALVAGALYLLTFVTSIPARVLFAPVLNDPNYILGPGRGHPGPVRRPSRGGRSPSACIGTAVVLYPVVKRQNETVALGFVGSRVLEAAIIVPASSACCRS